MDDIGALLFKYFEKVLAVLFGIALLVSLVLYGPWAYSTGYDVQLAEISLALEMRPRVTADQVPSVPRYARYFESAGMAPPQESLARTYIWPVLDPEEGAQMLPPSDLRLLAEKGFVEVNFQYNPNQQPTMGLLDFIGVEVVRAKVVDGEPGEFQTLTKSGDRDYCTPQELFDNNKKHAPLVAVQRRSDERRTGPVVAGLTVADLWSAAVDGKISVADVAPMVRSGIRGGYFTAEDLYEVQTTQRMLPWLAQEERRDFMRSEGRAPTQEELTNLVLRAAGKSGGGNYSRFMEQTDARQAQAAAGGEKRAARVIAWGEVTSFFDSNVSPDEKYSYKMRFWAKETGKGAGNLRQSKWATTVEQVAPKADTEFFLTGGSVMVGNPWVKVRKWMPSQNSWVSQDCQVAIGEEIGRKEMVVMLDAQGRPVRNETGASVMEEVDFSTQCVLLDFLASPRVASVANTGSRGPGFDVDTASSARYPMVTQAQILYSNRRGELKRKWQAPPSVD